MSILKNLAKGFGQFLAVPAVLCCLATAGPALAADSPVILEVPLPAEDGSEANHPSGSGGQVSGIYDRSLRRYFRNGAFSSVLAGRYLDEAPARRAAERFRARGLASFVLKKQVAERRVFGSEPVGDFYVVMVGLFGRNGDADILGQRLKAENQLPAYRVLPVDDPGEQTATEAQNAGLYARLSKVGRAAEQQASRPLSPDSPAVSGQAFKKRVYGRFVGSYRDLREAQQQAERLTAGGWPASVEREGSGAAAWFRVYLAPSEDKMDWKANPGALAEARSSAASQPGLFMLVDMSQVRGDVNRPQPAEDRVDASACAGFSEAGRLGGGLRRTLIYIPDTSYTAALIPMGVQTAKGLRNIPGRIKNWWDEKPGPARPALYGPAIFNRPEMEKAIGKLKSEEGQVSLALGLTEVAAQLYTVPGRKMVLVFSEFLGDDRPEDVQAALSRLQKEFGSSLEIVFIYGDTNADGLALANSLARQTNARAWDGCMLLNNNAYFERYIKTIFR
jgi:hypothetical protein